MSDGPQRQTGVRTAGWVAITFGGLTLLSGGLVLFGGGVVPQMAGQVVGFVLWFNFLAGIFYVLAGIGLLLRKRWAFWISLALFAGTFSVLSAFLFHVLQGGAYETRTFFALSLRAFIWAAITWIAHKATKPE